MEPSSYSERELPFSFTCNRCSLCCKEKIIRVNPYEAIRLAAHLGISTSYFLKLYTMARGTVLKVPYNGYCTFRNYTGCSVHRDRPLVCRLYPLRRATAADHTEIFTMVDTEPRCIALEGNAGTVGEYLSEQEAGDYIEAVDRYVGLTDVLVEALRRDIGSDRSLAENAARLFRAPDIYGQEPIPDWLDVDVAVSSYCARTGAPRPKTAFEKMESHIAALNEMSTEGAFVEDRTERIRTLARTTAVLGYSIGVNLDELSTEFISNF